MTVALSLCVIVRDEEERLARALASAHGGYDELIVVDTGSRDRSRDVAHHFGARVIEFTNANDADGTLLDFAAARNVALSAARGEYWWWMDADDVALPGTVSRLRAVARARPTAVRGVTRDGGTRWLRTRLAPRDGRHVWAGAIHEWVETPSGWCDDGEIVFEHRPRLHRGRAPLLRNLRILRRELAAGRARAREHFYIALTLDSLGQRESAIRAYEYLLGMPALFAADIAFARLYLARLLRVAGDVRAAAVQAVLVLRDHPRFAEAACLLGDVAADLGDRALAARWFERAIASGPCPLGPLFHEPACYDDYPRARLQAIRYT